MPSQDILFGPKNGLLSSWSSESIAIFLLGLFVILSVSEHLWPRHPTAKKTLGLSYKTNFFLFACNTLVMSLLSMSSLLLLAQQYAHQGLLRYLPNPFMQAVLSFLFLDLLLYFWHRLCHSKNILWTFHRVHHNDASVNTSTGFRVHPLELLLTNLVKAVYIVVMGVDQRMVLVNETIMTAAVMFHHSNIPVKAEKWLGRFLIVPALHRTHHSALRCEHDSNYGAVLSIWDRMFGSLQWRQPTAIGLEGETPLHFFGLILFGFTPIKPAVAANPVCLPSNLDEMIAEAAYYKAEKRNFMPGYELLDWIEAKKEIIGRFSYGHQNYQPRHRQLS